MYKILRSDDASDFDEIGWRYFNTSGGLDVSVNESTTNDDFIEYEYTQNDLEEFIAFAIKIRMQGTNSSEPPRIKDLRAIALTQLMSDYLKVEGHEHLVRDMGSILIVNTNVFAYRDRN